MQHKNQMSYESNNSSVENHPYYQHTPEVVSTTSALAGGGLVFTFDCKSTTNFSNNQIF
jgi:hypothetical protein